MMRVKATSIAGVTIVETLSHFDHRGSFSRFFCHDALGEIIGARQVLQINHSCTKVVGAVRGLHFQRPPHAEMKLVRCLRGKVWDIAVDLRAGSSTFLQWHAEELTPENGRMIVIPEGCAHGFQVLEGNSELLYLHTAFFTPDAEGGIRPTDSSVAVAWRLPIQDLSNRDREHPLISEDFQGLRV